ncbi:MAG TPA: protein translocase subunit SecD [bacterium]|nr:protein translocase subunit SecD [bacterium]HOL47293.1 protein translocase subunit SecD [bacterium]HPQ19755.1 protein translocase subunit SecD [bacterium]
MNKNLQWRLLVIILVFIFSFLFIFPLPKMNEWNDVEKWKDYFKSLNIMREFPKTINLGLDLKGGMYLVIQVDTKKVREQAEKEKAEDIEHKVQDAIDKVFIVLQRRIDEFGVAEPSIVKSGEKIIIQLPGLKDRTRAKNLVGSTAALEFRMVHLDNDKLLKYLVDEEGNLLPNVELPPGYEILYENPRNRDGSYKLDAKGQKLKVPYLISTKVELSGNDLKDAYVAFNQQTNQPYIQLILNYEATAKFADLTNKYKPVNEVYRRLAIILDNKVIMAPRIMSRIDNGRPIIEGGFSLEEAKDVAITLRAGALPVPIQIVQENTVGPSLGKDSIVKGIKAAIIGLILILVFMIYNYSFAGFIADLALIFNLIILMAAMAMLGATLTLPGIAGIILTIGMAVDANIIVYERIKEELRNGQSIKNAIEQGYSRAFVAIFDANLTTILTSIVLYQFGIGPIKGFAVTLTIGILANMFTALFFTRTLYNLSISNRVQIKSLSIFSLFTKYENQITKKREKIINFVSIRNICIGISLLVFLTGIISMIVNKGLKYGIDFTGGASILIKFYKEITAKEIEKLRNLFIQNGLIGSLQDFKSLDEEKSYKIKFVTKLERSAKEQLNIKEVATKIENILVKEFMANIETNGKINLNGEIDDENFLKVLYDIDADIILNEIATLTPIKDFDDLNFITLLKKYKLDNNVFKEYFVTRPVSLTETKKNINDISRSELKEFILHQLKQNEREYKELLYKLNELKREVLLTDLNKLKDIGFSENVIEKMKEKFYLSSFVIEDIQEIGPTISSDYSSRTIHSIIWALILILIYISWRFQFRFSVSAVVALIHDVLITLGIFSFISLEVDNQIVAAILTLIGYSLNDTIIIFDRIRENMSLFKNKNLSEIINISITQTLSRTILTSLTTLFAVISLYIFGGKNLNAFSFTLLVGIIIGTYSSIYIASPILLLLDKNKNSKNNILPKEGK